MHDHSKATPSTEADRLEREIEDIQDSLGELLSVLLVRAKRRIIPLLKNRRVHMALGGLYAYCFLRSFFCSRSKR